MSVLQGYQADLLKDLDLGEGLSLDVRQTLPFVPPSSALYGNLWLQPRSLVIFNNTMSRYLFSMGINVPIASTP